MVKDLEFDRELKHIIPYIAKIADDNHFYQFVDRKDLLYVGQVGFYKAFLAFKDQSPATLATYSFKFIKKEIVDYQNELKYPHFSREELKNYNLMNKHLEGKEELSNEDYQFLERKLSISKQEINYLLELSKPSRLSEEEFNGIIHTNHDDVNRSSKNPSFNVEMELLNKELIQRIDKVLNVNNKKVISLSYELEDENMNNKEIAHLLKISKTRIKQIIVDSLKKLRNDPIIKLLYVEYYYEGYFYGYKIDSYFINDKNQ